jgi:acyl-CoA synthetase (AMP-forming)/AMP-acid ligase II
LDEIKNFVALTHLDGQNKKLFFFIYIDINKDLKKTKVKIKNYINNNFPFFMLPSNIFFLKKDFPRNINGKVDKMKLIADYIIDA